jgi:hypothetical protein
MDETETGEQLICVLEASSTRAHADSAIHTTVLSVLMATKEGVRCKLVMA